MPRYGWRCTRISLKDPSKSPYGVLLRTFYPAIGLLQLTEGVSQVYDFYKESDNLTQIQEIICYLHKFMQENPVSYPQAMAVYLTLMEAVDTAIKQLDEAYELLDLELDMELPAYKHPADYQI